MNLRKLGNLGKILNKSGTARGSLGDHSGGWKHWLELLMGTTSRWMPSRFVGFEDSY